MIEFYVVDGASPRARVVSVDAIATVTPAREGQTVLTLTTGDAMTADVPYERFRDAIRSVRSQFVSLLEAQV
jgi:hypothetical protein